MKEKTEFPEMPSEEMCTTKEEPENLKTAINEFLYPLLPDSTNLRRMEQISVHFLEVIDDEWEKWRKTKASDDN